MRAGDLRWTAMIQSPPSTKLASGAPDPAAWCTVTTRRCKVVDVSGSKSNDGVGQMQLTTQYEVTMRRTPGILTSYRVTITGGPFDGVVMRVVFATDTLTDTILNCVVRSNQ